MVDCWLTADQHWSRPFTSNTISSVGACWRSTRDATQPPAPFFKVAAVEEQQWLQFQRQKLTNTNTPQVCPCVCAGGPVTASSTVPMGPVLQAVPGCCPHRSVWGVAAALNHSWRHSGEDHMWSKSSQRLQMSIGPRITCGPCSRTARHAATPTAPCRMYHNQRRPLVNSPTPRPQDAQSACHCVMVNKTSSQQP